MEIKTPKNVPVAPTAGAVAKATTKKSTALDFLKGDAFKAQIANALPAHLTSDRFIRAAMNEFRVNPALAECSIPSVLGYFMQSAALGLEPSGCLGQAYPVPFNNTKTGQKEAQFILGYRGMISLARRSGDLLSIDAHVVYENDDFELTYGTEQKLKHVPCIDGDPGEIKGAYCVVHLRDAEPMFRFMPKREIDAHRRRSKSGNSGPWNTDYEAMACKTVVRAIFKYLPVSIDIAHAMDADNNVVNYDAKNAKPGAEIDDMIEVSFTEPDVSAEETASEAVERL